VSEKRKPKPTLRMAGLFSVVILAAMAAIVWHFNSRSTENENGLAGGLDIGGNRHVETLKRLNESWELPDDYVLETFEVDGIAMEKRRGTGSRDFAASRRGVYAFAEG